MSHPIETIGRVRSPYKEKFAVPRQPGLVSAAEAVIELCAPYNQLDTVRELATFSHIWVLFLFSENLAKRWQPLVRPPRLGGNRKVGVFASRSTFRPNGIGMSVVKLLHVEADHKGVRLHVEAGDWMDGTPVIDIKPYLAYSDAIADASSGYAAEAPNASMPTRFTELAQQKLEALVDNYPKLEQLIRQVLAQDPRPAYQQASSLEREFGVGLYDLNVRWRVENNENIVFDIA